MSTQAIAADPRSEIEARNLRFMEAFRRGDAASVAGLYTASARLLPAHSDFVDGTDAIQRFWQGAMDMGLKEAVLETLEVEAHGETAHEVGRYTLKTAGGQVADAGKYLVVWKQEGGAWKLHRDIWTTNRPAA
ncbi:MAG: YybH family protein [Gemmatimonadales bacterium]